MPAILDDVCAPIFGQFPVTVRNVAEIIGERHSPELVLTRQALWGMLTEVTGGPFTENLKNCLSAYLEARMPHWEAKVTQPKLPTITGRPSQPGARTRRRRTPDLESSRQRLGLVDALATELATLKRDLEGFCTVEGLKAKYPQFILWQHIQHAELKELVTGEPFALKAYAETLTLRKFGITSRETLKKDRRKLKLSRTNPGAPRS